MRACLRAVMIAVVGSWAMTAVAEDAYYRVSLGDLKFAEGGLPEEKSDSYNWRYWNRYRDLQPYAVVEGGAEAYVRSTNGGDFQPVYGNARQAGEVLVRAEAGHDLGGRLYFPNSDWSGMVILKFTIPASAASDNAREPFFRGKQAYYQTLLSRNLPGSAWFRHQVRESEAALGEHNTPATSTAANWRNSDELATTYDLFTGGRAISENLQLERTLPPMNGKQELVDVDSINGITVQAIDWTALNKDLKPALDPLAAKLPADQHALFFATFNDALKLSDDFNANGATVLSLADPRAEDARTVERYQRQLGLSLTTLGRLLGPRLARSVAVTGSDPYFPTGTDVAVLFESPNPELLQAAILAQLELHRSATPGAENIKGEIDGLSYSGLLSPDRSVSSYVATLDQAVVVTNSPYQLKRLAAVKEGKTPALASLPEYTFFRSRYPLGDKQETALLFLSDATIRRWCSARWRIGDSRRTRDAAVMAELQATYLDRLAKGGVQTGAVYTDLPLAGGELTLTSAGVRSSTLGSLEFMTPIAEMNLQKVTQTEAQAYERWRDNYQSNWRWAFDPIALRLGLEKHEVSADLSVMPLIWRSEYRPFLSVVKDVKIAPDAGDRHDALAHWILAINHKSEPLMEASNLASSFAPQLKVDPFGWLGQWVAVYVDDDPVWAEIAKIPPEKRDEDIGKFLPRLPIAFQADVSSSLKLTVFLTGLRAFIQQTAPNMTTWESLDYKDQAYVRITASEVLGSPDGDRLRLYYAITSKGLLVTLSEDLLKRALDRQLAHKAEAKTEEPADAGAEPKPDSKATETATASNQPWLGESLNLQVDKKIFEVLAGLAAQEYQQEMQARCWANLPILNEWKRRYPDRDPVKLHEQFWQIGLVCPGGGQYVWNDKWQTMESTVYGHPGEPKLGPPAPPQLSDFDSGNFGLTLEDQGLRARVSLKREPAGAQPAASAAGPSASAPSGSAKQR